MKRSGGRDEDGDLVLCARVDPERNVTVYVLEDSAMLTMQLPGASAHMVNLDADDLRELAVLFADAALELENATA